MLFNRCMVELSVVDAHTRMLFTIEGSKLSIYRTTWTDLLRIMLSEKGQSQRLHTA